MAKFTKILALASVACALFVSGACAEGTEPSAAAQTGGMDAVAAVEAAKQVVAQPKDVTIYGEVQSVNTAGGSMTVQYYDYDTDEEKSIELAAGAETKIENAASLADIKKGDWADITYLAQGAKNMARSIIVEKEEEVPAETGPEGETKE